MKRGASKTMSYRLPFARTPRGIDEWRPLSVDRASLAVGVGGILERVEHLNLVLALEKDAAVTAVLAGAADDGRGGPLHVQLHVAKRVLRREVAGVRHDLDITVLHLPRLAARCPLRQVLTGEEHDGVR